MRKYMYVNLNQNKAVFGNKKSRCADDIVLLPDTEREFQELLQKKREKQELNVQTIKETIQNTNNKLEVPQTNQYNKLNI